MHPLRAKSRPTKRKSSATSTAACPLCRKKYSTTFLPLHASSCKLPAKPSLSKRKAAASNHLQSRLPLLGPRYLSKLPPNAAPSERAAPGFHVFENIFTHCEANLLQLVVQTPPQWADYRFRESKNYGPVYDLAARRFRFGRHAPEEVPLPAYAKEIVLPVLRSLHSLLKEFHPNQLAVGRYARADSHIKPHNDCENAHIQTGVVGVCLGAACTMTLTLRAKESGLGKDVKRDIRLPRGAVYIMSGDALRVWHHAIFEGKTEGTRVSLTFRDVEPHRSDEEAKWSVREGVVRERKQGKFIQSELRK